MHVFLLQQTAARFVYQNVEFLDATLMDMCIASGGHGEQLRSLMKAGNVTDLSTPITRDIDINMLPVDIQHLLQENMVSK